MYVDQTDKEIENVEYKEDVDETVGGNCLDFSSRMSIGYNKQIVKHLAI